MRFIFSLGIVALFGLASFGLSGCALPRNEVAAPRSTPHLDVDLTHRPGATERIIVITIDGVMWQDVFGGVSPERAEKAGLPPSFVLDGPQLLPNLYGLARKGIVSGAPGYGPPMTASGPNYVSLPGYTEIFTGQAGRCKSNICGRTTIPTILDVFRNQVVDRDEDIAVFASWKTYENAVSIDPRHMVVSTGITGGQNRERTLVNATTREIEVSTKREPFKVGQTILGDYRGDRYTGKLALEYLKAKAPKVLVVGLGDTDEYAHKSDYRSYITALQNADSFIGEVVDELRKMRLLDTTTILVTTDHGREGNFTSHGWFWPESDRVWMVAAGGAVPAWGYLTEGQFEHLSDIAPFLKALMTRPTRE